MTVYVLQYSTYDWNDIVGVYSSRELAAKAQEDHWSKVSPTVEPIDLKYFHPAYDIYERALDTPIGAASSQP